MNTVKVGHIKKYNFFKITEKGDVYQRIPGYGDQVIAQLACPHTVSPERWISLTKDQEVYQVDKQELKEHMSHQRWANPTPDFLYQNTMNWIWIAVVLVVISMVVVLSSFMSGVSLTYEALELLPVFVVVTAAVLFFSTSTFNHKVMWLCVIIFFLVGMYYYYPQYITFVSWLTHQLHG